MRRPSASARVMKGIEDAIPALEAEIKARSSSRRPYSDLKFLVKWMKATLEWRIARDTKP